MPTKHEVPSPSLGRSTCPRSSMDEQFASNELGGSPSLPEGSGEQNAESTDMVW